MRENDGKGARVAADVRLSPFNEGAARRSSMAARVTKPGDHASSTEDYRTGTITSD